MSVFIIYHVVYGFNFKERLKSSAQGPVSLNRFRRTNFVNLMEGNGKNELCTTKIGRMTFDETGPRYNIQYTGQKVYPIPQDK